MHIHFQNRVLNRGKNFNVQYNYADGSTPTGPRRYVRIGIEWRQALDFDAPSVGKMNTSLQAQGVNAPPPPGDGK